MNTIKLADISPVNALVHSKLAYGYKYWLRVNAAILRYGSNGAECYHVPWSQALPTHVLQPNTKKLVIGFE